MLQTKKNFWGKRPGFDFGDILHIGVNTAFVAVVYALVAYWSLPTLAIGLIFLGKWRTFAVQPRFWLPNIKANLVDFIVGISSVLLIHQSSYTWLGILWAVLYIGWLLFVKPRDSSLFVGLQAFWAQFIGLLVLFMIPTAVKTPLLTIVLIWLIAWSAARHFFSNYDESQYKSMALIWGLLVSQLAWIMLHWVQYYTLLDTKIATLPIIVTILSASIGSMYHSYKNEALQRSVVVENSIFAGALLAVVLVTAGWVAKL